MCLDSRDTRFKRPPAEQVFTAYKVMMESRRGVLRFPYIKGKVNRGEWNQAVNKRLHYNCINWRVKPKSYSSGFHVFENKSEALYYMRMRTLYSTGKPVVVKVKVRGVRVRGRQTGISGCLVADEIYFPKKKV